jgi:hypothetical protein
VHIIRKKIFGLEVIDNLAYFIENDRGFLIYNVSNPPDPEYLSEYSVSYPQDLAIEGKDAIIIPAQGDPASGVITLDISDPHQPSELGVYTDTSHGHNIHVEGNIYYIGDEDNGLKIIDNTDPTNPLLLGVWTDNEGSHVGDVYVIENYAFVELRIPQINAPSIPLGLKLIDVHDPANITEIGIIGDGNEFKSVPSAHVDNLVYMGDFDNGFKILNFTDPRNVYCIGLHNDGGSANDIQIDDHFIFIADGDDGLEIVDVINSTDPIEVAQYDSDWTVVRVDIEDDLVYLGTIDKGIRIIDLKMSTSKATNFSIRFSVIFLLISVILAKKRRNSLG